MNQLIELIPHWLAWPLSLLSAATAIAGAGLVFYGAGFGDGGLAPFVWGGISFAISGLLWWVSDLASSNRPF
jgi:hypothetical protein